jgi:transposase
MEAKKMEVLYGTCSGVDVHKKLLVVCLRRGKKSEIRSFGTTTQELFDAVEWLKNNGCEMVAMESTGSYWKPLYNVLEAMEVPAMVVNAQHMKAVPG